MHRARVRLCRQGSWLTLVMTSHPGCFCLQVPTAFKAQYARDAAPAGSTGGGAGVSSKGKGKSKAKGKGKDEAAVWDKQIALNIPAVVEGFRTLGQGLVKSITLKE